MALDFIIRDFQCSNGLHRQPVRCEVRVYTNDIAMNIVLVLIDPITRSGRYWSDGPGLTNNIEHVCTALRKMGYSWGTVLELIPATGKLAQHQNGMLPRLIYEDPLDVQEWSIVNMRWNGQRFQEADFTYLDEEAAARMINTVIDWHRDQQWEYYPESDHV